MSPIILHKKLKVIHLTNGDLSGGAGIGAYLTHKGLLELSIDSHLLCSHRPSIPLHNVESLVKSPLDNFIFSLRARLLGKGNLRFNGQRVSMFSAGFLGSAAYRHPLVKSADIVHLHWVNGAFLSTSSIAKLGKPIVWTLRDMWPFTGGCHYSFDCDHFSQTCGKCPLFGGKFQYDRTYWQQRNKAKTYAKIPSLHPVGISPWMAEQAQRSTLFRSRTVRSIWNGVNLSDFQQIDKGIAREQLGLAANRPYLCFGAVNLEYSYKGYQYMESALGQLRSRWDESKQGPLPALLVFGRGGESLVKNFPGSRHFGFVSDNGILNQIYAASNAFLMPSRQEAFGKTIVEALASGTPVVCFDYSGPRDMIEHQVDGYKARPFDTADFAHGIDWCLQAGDKIANACAHASKTYCHLASAKEYQKLYQEILAT